MKKAIHWLDEYLEEFLMVVFLIAMTLIMGIQVFSRYILGSITFMVGRDHKISVSSGRHFLSVSLMYEENAYQLKLTNLSSCFRRRGKSLFEGFESYRRVCFFCLPDTICFSYI